MLGLFLVFILISILNLLYYVGFFQFAFDKSQQEQSNLELPVSVIICAKNEAENLRSFLPAVLSQNYPNFEVVVINDASTDETLEVIEEFQARDKRVKLVNVQNNEAFWANKKYALTLGIKKAVNPFLLFTDADCRPETDQWISGMSSHFQDRKSIILGYGGYLVKKRSFLNKLIRFETLFTAIQYFSYAKWGIPYMGVGRNLAYTSKAFYEQNGFASHLHVRSGDDDLFVNEAATGQNTALCFSPVAITRSIPKDSYKEWVVQKRRHISTAHKYKVQHRLLLSLFFLTQLFFWVLFLILIFTPYWQFSLGILALRLIVQGTVFYKSAKKLMEDDLIWLFPFLEVFLICAQFGIFISNTISKPKNWK